MVPSVVSLIRLLSATICVIAIASFALFALDRTSAASGFQRETLNAEIANSPQAPPARLPTTHPSPVRQTLDEVTSTLTSPFDPLVSGNSQWGERIARLLVALVVYGFGLGYLARVLRVRVG